MQPNDDQHDRHRRDESRLRAAANPWRHAPPRFAPGRGNARRYMREEITGTHDRAEQRRQPGADAGVDCRHQDQQFGRETAGTGHAQTGQSEQQKETRQQRRAARRAAQIQHRSVEPMR
ncbi:MAG: hypothetical protein MZV65_17810 [Chromatiales bacterium]|nr:hypothetical protein [Chromatiales bacterium]